MSDFVRAVETWLSTMSVAEGIGLGVTAAVTVALLILVRRWLRPACARALAVLDEKVPAAELGALEGATTRTALWIASLIVLFAGGLVGAAVVGADTSAVTDRLTDWTIAALQAAAPVAVRLAILLAITLLAIRIIRATIPSAIKRALRKRAEYRSRDLEETDKRAATLATVAAKVCIGVTVVIAGFVGLSELGFDIGPMLAGAGVAGLAIGFGAQNLVRDHLSGMFILMEDQYRVGDVIAVGGITGMVEEVTLRRTVIRDLDKTAHTIPNGEVAATSNYSKEYSQVHVDIQVAYKEDIDRVIELINEVGKAMYDEGAVDGTMREPIYVKRVSELADSGIAIKVLGLTDPGDQWAVRGELLRRLKRAFDDRGIEIPFPHRTLYWGADQPALARTDATASRAARADRRA